MKGRKIAYWVFTGLMCALFIFSASMYFTQTDMVREAFGKLGFPAWLVIPLAIAKLLGVIAVLTDKVAVLREWAYAGFFFDALMAFSAHIYAADGEFIPALLAIILTALSRMFYKYRSIAA